MPLQASKIDTCRIARAREAFGGDVRSTSMAFSATEFQSVTISARATEPRMANAKRESRIIFRVFMGNLIEVYDLFCNPTLSQQFSRKDAPAQIFSSRSGQRQSGFAVGACTAPSAPSCHQKRLARIRLSALLFPRFLNPP